MYVPFILIALGLLALSLFTNKPTDEKVEEISEDDNFDYINLLSRRTMVKDFIESTPKESVICLGSLNSELEQIEEQITKIEEDRKDKK